MTQEKCIRRLLPGMLHQIPYVCNETVDLASQVISPFNIAILVADRASWHFQCTGKVHVVDRGSTQVRRIH